jgi:hypothetical protein
MAKLRLHTDETLELLDQNTIQLGAEFRKFQNVTCVKFKTKELKREAEARGRKAAASAARAKAKTQKKPSTPSHPAPPTSSAETTAPPSAVEHAAMSSSTEPEAQSQASRHAHLPPCILSPPIVPLPSHDPPDSLSNPTKNHSSQKSATGRRFKMLNLHTYKHHALGDYAEMIRRYGTTDSYSTEPVSPF